MSRANTSPAPPQPDLDQEVAAVRGFNRFYTRKLGVLDQHLLDSPFSLSEARVMYELAHRDDAAAKEIGIELGLDAGYLSRMVQNFEENGLITRKPLPTDRRQYQLSLTAKGRQAFARLDRRSHDEVGAMLGQLGEAERARLVNAMQTIEHVLGPQTGARPGFLLRSHRPGDIGWVVSRHGAIYAQEYGWDISFEALVAEITAQFIRSFDPSREHCWIAEIDGEPVGSIMLVDAGDRTAKLRLLLVEPCARGHGIGRRLVTECVRFAREADYRKITLWTQSILIEARAIYERCGFAKVAEKPHRDFGVDLVGETWEMEL
jgi:DNA-binding MarR family transcriptional regulator/GNAT superfamily N-acetyltransferase